MAYGELEPLRVPNRVESLGTHLSAMKRHTQLHLNAVYVHADNNTCTSKMNSHLALIVWLKMRECGGNNINSASTALEITILHLMEKLGQQGI